MRIGVVLVQLLIVCVVIALVLPGVLATMPSAREGSTALAIAGGIGVVMFVLLRVIWPARRT